jgi:hypothetical protein
MRAAIVALGLAFATPAFAQETARGEASFDTTSGFAGTSYEGDSDTLPGALVIGGEVGAIFPQPFSELGTHIAFGLELGYRLPMWGQRLEIMAAGAFSPPGNTEKIRHGGAGDRIQYEGEIDQQMLMFSLGPRFRVMDRASPWNVTIAAGGRMFLLRTWSNGSRGGNDFAEFTEESTQWGFFVALGGEYMLGPGAIFLDVDLGWSDLPHRITGDVSTGNITPTLGYRLFLL